MANHDYTYLKDKLPKPITQEEQYLYSLVMAAANIPHEEPFQTPFWRMEQYWKAFYEVMSDRYIYIVPSINTVTTNAIVDNSVTTGKLATETEKRLLGENRVSNDMIINGSITLGKLASEVAARLVPVEGVPNSGIADGAVTSSKILDASVTMNKLSAEVRDLLATMKDKLKI